MTRPVGLDIEADGTGVTLLQGPGTSARALFTSVAHGDLSRDAEVDPGFVGRCATVAPTPWTLLHQVHGASVVEVDAAGHGSGEPADAAVTNALGATLAVRTADCVPVALLSAEGPVGVVHAGWRGLAAGVVGAAVERLGRLGARSVVAVIGPAIEARCYEFGAADLEEVVAAVGPVVRATTDDGSPALDVVAGVAAACLAAGVDHVEDLSRCTACADDLWSHRARGDRARQAAVVWRVGP